MTSSLGLLRGMALVFVLGQGSMGSLASAAEAPLADAAERMDRERLLQLLRDGVHPDQEQVDGMTALHWAAYHDDLQAATALVGAKANVKCSNRYGVAPLSLACTNGNEALVELLLGAGADPNTALRGGETALMTAARTGKPGPIRALIARGAQVDATERKGQTALMWAAAEGHVEAVQTLLEAGADFRASLRSGFTPLLFAAREGRTDVVQALLKAGADVNATTTGRSAGRAARSGTSAILLAVENGHFELALALVNAGADPNDQRSGFAALHALTWIRKPNRGDDPDGDPAPRGSGQMSSLQFVRELVARGANVNLQLKSGASGRGILSKVGASPFLLAAVTADVPLMRLLVELGADPRLPNADGCTPLMAAAGVGTKAPGEEAGTEPEALEAVALTLELGCDVNAVDRNGETAMHGAAYKSFPKVVEFLASHGAKIAVWNQKNKYGWTPLLIAHGYRVGNFKPSADTIAAIQRVMLALGVTPPANPRPTAEGEY